MSGSNDQTLSGVTETLLMPLYIRALESQRPDALLKDEKAVALVRQMDYDSSRILAKVDEEVRVAVLLRNRQIDQHAISAAAWMRALSVWITAGWSGMTWICRRSSNCAGN